MAGRDDQVVANRERRQERADWLIRRDLNQAGMEVRSARMAAGLTLQEVASVLGVSHPTVLRAERGSAGTDLTMLARLASVVGLRARLRLYPDGDPIRDAGQVALIRRFRERVGEVGSWTFEVPIPAAHDRRALDAVLTITTGRIGLEFYTRLADVQAQLRAATLKKRDAGLDRMIVVVQGTRRNRLALREAGEALDSRPGKTRAMLAALKAGVMPDADGIVLL
jgi:transcriptional regulator with XRE-family HTH domain